jgi:hypothetical protein
MDLNELEYEDIDWIHVGQDRNQWRAIMNTALDLWVP